jgi:long-subunit acyl-CoA synthetase (AMP-forming)
LRAQLPRRSLRGSGRSKAGDALNDARFADAATDLALLIATSGSEGAPKVVMLSEANIDAAAAAANERLPLHPGDLWLACLPLHHIGGIAILGRCLARRGDAAPA